MKLKNITYAMTGMALIAAMSSCEDEKDLIIIEGNLPIKTTTLYMVGDATPNGWSIDTPTPFEATADDELVFSWEGSLNTGELKLCLTTGSWDAGFIRPMANGEEIGREEIVDAEFQMHAGDPDEKWRVTEAGKYLLTFDLRNWRMSSSYLGAADLPPVEPITTDVLYIVGDATPNSWNIDSPTLLEKTADYIFEYEGKLTVGDFKACLTTGSWDVSFVRPATDGVKIDQSGVENDSFIFVANPDNKWHVAEAGIYHLTFDLENYKIKAEFKEPYVIEKTPIESATLYMVGDATPGGWSMDNPTALTPDAANKYIFTWEGDLVKGYMKACLEPDGTFSCPFIRPASANVEISSAGVASPDFVYTTNPDNQWSVTEAGRYNITFDLEHLTITVKWLGGGSSSGDDNEKKPLESATLYMIGDATPGGWSMDDPTAFTSTEKYVFTWEGELKAGEMKACLAPDGTFSCPFLRPASDGCIIDENGVASPEFVYTTGPDYKWRVAKAGRYKITFNLKNWTIEAKAL